VIVQLVAMGDEREEDIGGSKHEAMEDGGRSNFCKATCVVLVILIAAMNPPRPCISRLPMPPFVISL
jgi:hypothetical protein